MSKGSKRRPAAIDEAEQEAAWRRTFGRKKPARKLADPATCAHRNKVFTTDGVPRCADCGTSLTAAPVVRTFHGVGKQDAFVAAAKKIIDEYRPALEYLARGEPEQHWHEFDIALAAVDGWRYYGCDCGASVCTGRVEEEYRPAPKFGIDGRRAGDER
jgi:hypothetical protein